MIGWLLIGQPANCIVFYRRFLLDDVRLRPEHMFDLHVCLIFNDPRLVPDRMFFVRILIAELLSSFFFFVCVCVCVADRCFHF